MTDTELLDWLQLAIDNGSSISFEKHHNCGLASYDSQFNETNILQIFTVPSQHVRGANIRDVIQNAAKEAKKRKITHPYITNIP